MSDNTNFPWWWPVVCDDEYFSRLREDYPDTAEWSNDDLLNHYNDGLKYQRLWDHIGDAYEQFEPLADAFLSLQQQLTQRDKGIKELIEGLDELLHMDRDDLFHEDYDRLNSLVVRYKQALQVGSRSSTCKHCGESHVNHPDDEVCRKDWV